MADRDARRGLARVIVSAAVGLVLLPVLVNVATGDDAPRWAIPAVLVLGAAAIGLAVSQYRADHRVAPGGQFPAAFRERALRRARSVLDSRLAYRPPTWAEIDLVAAPERVRTPAELTVVGEGAAAPDHVRVAFEQAGRSLLLLGAPGAGKTTQLLDLADRLLTRAEADDGAPIPLLLDLGSFRPVRTLRGRSRAGDGDGGWLLRSLRREYGLGRQVAEEWLAAHRLVLLLDGLDEVPRAHRGECVRWLNDLQDHYRVPPMVVCSRDGEYAETPEALALQHAVRIAPLHRARVAAWLAAGGPSLAHVRHAIDADPTLWELLDAPLWLDLLAAVAESSPGDDPGGSVAQRREALLDAYVDEALRRGDQSPGYTRVDVVRWLSRLARPGSPVVASRWGPGLVAVRGPVPRAAAIKVAGPVMTLVALAGAAILSWHAGAAVAGGAVAAALTAVVLWRGGGRRPGVSTGWRGLLPLCSAVVLVGAALSAVALAAAAGLSALVGMLPRAPLGRDASGAPTWAVDWVSVLAGLLILAVCLGLIAATAATVSAYRAAAPAARPLREFPGLAGRGTLAAVMVLAVAAYALGMSYLILIAVPAEYMFTVCCTLAFFAVGGGVGIVTAAVSEGGVAWGSREDYWISFLGLTTAVVALLIAWAHGRGWIPRAVSFHLAAAGAGAGIGLYLAVQFRRLTVSLDRLAAFYLAAGGYLPWRLTRLLRYAARRDLLRAEGRDYRFRHQLFAEHFTRRAGAQ